MGVGRVVRWLGASAHWARRGISTIYFVASLRSVHISPPFSFPLRQAGAAGFRLQEQRRLARGVRLGRTRPNRCGNSRFPSRGSVKSNVGILVGNYGEAGARSRILALHITCRLPISLTNSFYLRTYPAEPPSTLILIGWSQRRGSRFTRAGCGHNGNSLGVKNEESDDDPDIFVCGPPRQGWPEFWRTNQHFS